MSDLTWLREQAAATEALADLLRAHDIDRMECHDHPDDVCCPSCHDLPPGTSQTQHYAHVLIAESPLSGLCVLSGCRRVAAERLVEENRGTLDGIEATGSAPPVEERIQDVIEGKAPDDDGYAGPVLDDHQSRAAREILVDHAGPALEQAVDIAQHAPFRATIEVTMDQEQRVHFTAHRPDDESVLLDVFPAATHRVTNASDDDTSRTALLTFTFYKGSENLAEVECSSNELQAGESSKMDCFSTDSEFPTGYKTIKVADAF